MGVFMGRNYWWLPGRLLEESGSGIWAYHASQNRKPGQKKAIEISRAYSLIQWQETKSMCYWSFLWGGCFSIASFSAPGKKEEEKKKCYSERCYGTWLCDSSVLFLNR
ncbi:hypothetical protein CEXT_310051 [Caerostris extrusa]|uniref:Uncharacterized protein n=1 Tax=Caerostris extrusa TaxID=172846 RepID=A0AAV4P522_CAEEX|nr:hypothetical protein CEXT_310051 [Caerostris extrusa]